jgi:hypothetical protein
VGGSAQDVGGVLTGTVGKDDFRLRQTLQHLVQLRGRLYEPALGTTQPRPSPSAGPMVAKITLPGTATGDEGLHQRPFRLDGMHQVMTGPGG